MTEGLRARAGQRWPQWPRGAGPGERGTGHGRTSPASGAGSNRPPGIERRADVPEDLAQFHFDSPQALVNTHALCAQAGLHAVHVIQAKG